MSAKFPHNDPEYDKALADVSAAEQTNPCTCQMKAKERTGSALYPSLLDFTQDLDPDCELHNPWVLEDEAARMSALRWWFAGRQVGFDVGQTVGDRALADALVAAVDPLDEEAMYEAEGAIFERIGMSLDETERGPTELAVKAVEAFVSHSLERPWTYAESSRGTS